MAHFASRQFWTAFNQLPQDIRDLADRCYELLERDASHPSLHLKKVGKRWSVRVGRRHRAVAVEIDGGLLWIWIGTHADYDRLLGDD